MLSTNRDEFAAQMRILCDGFNVPLGERVDAYFKGCAKMSLIEFARVVAHALGEDGPEKIPNTGQVWKILHTLKARARAQTFEQPQDTRDHLEYYANRLLLRHMGNRLGLGSRAKFVPGHGLVDAVASAELSACRKVTRALVDWFTQPVREGADDATPAAFIESFIRALAAVSVITPATLREWAAQLKDPAAQVPFPPWTARPLPRTADAPRLERPQFYPPPAGDQNNAHAQ
jgi:hypothetical protein